MVSVFGNVFGWPDPNTTFGQSEHVLYTCYFIMGCSKYKKVMACNIF